MVIQVFHERQDEAETFLSLLTPLRAGGEPKWGGGNVCPKCEKTVYFAEQLKVMVTMEIKIRTNYLSQALFQTWHKNCFTCTGCNKRLDTSTCCDKDEKVIIRQDLSYSVKTLMIMLTGLLQDMLRKKLWTKRRWIRCWSRGLVNQLNNYDHQF